MDLLKDLGVDLEVFKTAYDASFYRRNGLGPAIYFDKAHYAQDKLIPGSFADVSAFLQLADSGLSMRDGIATMPLQADARAQLAELYTISEDMLPNVGLFSEAGYLSNISYRDFLTGHLGVTHPQVLDLLQHVPDSYFGVGIDAIPAAYALMFGMPGLSATSLGTFGGLFDRVKDWLIEPYIYHFPDGNATIARLLVKALIPEVCAAVAPKDLVTALFDYSQLDRPTRAVRLRLDSTVTRVTHQGDPSQAKWTLVDYVRGGASFRVRARHTILACYNMVIPYICPELPETQRSALSSLVKTPLVYTNLALKNWQAFKRAGVGMTFNPGSYHHLAMLDFPVSMGNYRFSSDADQPIVLHMNRVPGDPGKAPDDQHRAGRSELLTTTFESIERDVRLHLAGMLGSYGLDPASDILGITVNRWPHGYAKDYNPLFDKQAEPEDLPHMKGRKHWGRIAIANSDSGARAYLDCAIDQAHRAVGELLAG